MEHVIKQRLLKSKKQELPCPFKCIVIQEKSDIRHPISTPKGMVLTIPFGVEIKDKSLFF